MSNEDWQRHKTGRLVVVLGACVFLTSLAGDITAEHTWGHLLAPSVLIPSLGKVAGWLLAYLGAREMLPKEKN